MIFNFEHVTVQSLLNEIRTNQFGAVVKLRFFVCYKYKAYFLAKHPHDEILSDPQTFILPPDYETDAIFYELFRTNLSEDDLWRMALLNYQQYVNTKRYALILDVLAAQAITQFCGIAIHILASKNSPFGSLQIGSNFDEFISISKDSYKPYQASIDQLNRQYWNFIDETHITPSEIDVFLLKRYMHLRQNVGKYICDILTKVYCQHNDVISEERIAQQAMHFNQVFHYITFLQKEAEEAQDRRMIELSQHIEQILLNYMLLSLDDKKASMQQIRNCCFLLDTDYSGVNRLKDAIAKLLNFVIHTLNHGFSANLSLFRLTAHGYLQEELPLLIQTAELRG